jgi:16S rRNA (guanine(966)-N(2))-methyltransferase RsmD
MQKKSAHQANRQVRIIAGLWKRTPITVVDAPGLRPTPDRVRETLFNWLNFLFQANWQSRCCLDLFAGSGALGFEAASRGALLVTLVESHRPALQQLEKMRDKLKAQQLQIIQGDALVVVKKLAVNGNNSVDKYDVIFLDPPFHRDLLAQILPDCLHLLKEDGLLYLEAEKALEPSDLPDCLDNWQVIRCDRAGKVFFHLLQCNKQ